MCVYVPLTWLRGINGKKNEKEAQCYVTVTQKIPLFFFCLLVVCVCVCVYAALFKHYVQYTLYVLAKERKTTTAEHT